MITTNLIRASIAAVSIGGAATSGILVSGSGESVEDKGQATQQANAEFQIPSSLGLNEQDTQTVRYQAQDTLSDGLPAFPAASSSGSLSDIALPLSLPDSAPTSLADTGDQGLPPAMPPTSFALPQNASSSDAEAFAGSSPVTQAPVTHATNATVDGSFTDLPPAMAAGSTTAPSPAPQLPAGSPDPLPPTVPQSNAVMAGPPAGYDSRSYDSGGYGTVTGSSTTGLSQPNSYGGTPTGNVQPAAGASGYASSSGPSAPAPMATTPAVPTQPIYTPPTNYTPPANRQPAYQSTAAQPVVSQPMISRPMGTQSTGSPPIPAQTIAYPAPTAGNEFRSIQDQPNAVRATAVSTAPVASGLPHVTPAPRGNYATSPYNHALFQTAEFQRNHTQPGGQFAVYTPANPGRLASNQLPAGTQPVLPPNQTSPVYPAPAASGNVPPMLPPSVGTANPASNVPGAYVPPTYTANAAPTLYSSSNTGINPLVTMGQENYNVQLGRGMVGQPTVYVPGQPVRNFFRWIFP